jgi:hypothetical protein
MPDLQSLGEWSLLALALLKIALGMKLTFRKHEVKDLRHLQSLVTEHADAIESGCRIVAAGVNLGRSTVDLVGVDGRRTPVLVALGFSADDEMLFRMLEAFAWSLEYPESVRRVVGEEPGTWPPRVVFVAERVLETFLRKLRLLKFPVVDCFEFRCVDVNGATGFYLDAVDWARPSRPPADLPSAEDHQPAPALQPLVPPPTTEPPDVPAPTPEPSLPTRAADRNGADGERESPPRWLELLNTPAESPAPQAAPPVEAARASLETPAPSEPPTVHAPAEAEGKRDPLDELDLPANKEMAPTWRKFLERLTGGFDALATSAVAEAGPAAAQGAEPEPAVLPPPAPPVPETPPARNGTSPAQIPIEKRVRIDGVQLPANGELAPQWRKFLDKPAIDESKIRTVKEYMHREFPLCTIYDFFEFQRNAQVFQLQDNQGKVAQVATITAEFFEARRDPEIRPWLEKHRLAHAMRQAGEAGVLVAPNAVRTERR